MNVILDGALIILAGLFVGKIVNMLKLPAVTGYLIAGILLGPSALNLVTNEMISASVWISHGALGLIAFSIGSQFTISNIRRLGAGVIWIAFLEAIGATIVVTLAMIFIFRQSFEISILYGAIAAATAPAATILVIRELRARGPLTDTLLSVVAIDDPICVMAFGIATGVAAMLTANTGISLAGMVVKPLWEIVISLAIGAAIGFMLSIVAQKIGNKSDLQTLTLGMIFACVGLSLLLDLSPLLTCMALGSAVGNISRQREKIFDTVSAMDSPVYVAFFTLSGAGLHVEYLSKVGLIGIGYVIFRVIGKMAGASLGAAITKAPAVVRKYLGLGLVPQAGVALGLSLLVKQQFPGFGEYISTTIVATTVIYELIGPVCSKLGITLAGEAGCGIKKTGGEEGVL